MLSKETKDALKSALLKLGIDLPAKQVVKLEDVTLIDGTVFDSSVDRGEPAEFQVNRVIKGWTEGLQLMAVGSKYRLFIPQELAYGANPQPGSAIKPYMPLVFEVELLGIESPNNSSFV